MNQGCNFLGGTFSNGDNVRAPIQFRRESQPQHLKRWFFPKSRPIHFHINSTSVIRPVKKSQLGFSGNEINKPLLAPVHIVLQLRFKLRSQFQLLPQIRCLIALSLESSIISINSKITGNINRMVNSVQQEKCRAKTWTLEELQMETLKYWVGVQRGHSYLMGRRCLFSFGWPPF